MRAVELIMRYCPQFQFEVQSNNSSALDCQPSKMILHGSLSGWPEQSCSSSLELYFLIF